MKTDVKSPHIISNIPSRYYLISKRIIDIVGSLVLLVLLAPMIFIIALIIKLTSPGPVFFRQERLGQNARHYIFLKFQ